MQGSSRDLHGPNADMTGDEGDIEGSSQPLIELTCSTDSASCMFATWLIFKEDDKGRKTLFTLDTACQVHKKSGNLIPTLAARRAGESLLSATLERVRSTHSRAGTPLPPHFLNGKGRGGSVPLGPTAASMSQVSRLRWTKSPAEPNLPKPPPPAAPTEPPAEGDDIEEYLDAVKPGMGVFAKHLRALGIDSVDTLLTLEEDEWSTIIELSHHSDPPLSYPESQLLYHTLTPSLMGR